MNLAKHLRLFFLMLAAVLGALDSWSTRHSVNPMGISYLDMGDAFFRADWHTALNGLWSPMYSWPLGLLIRLVKPSPAWEFPLVHLVNFLIYLAALFAFDLFLSELIRSRRERAGSLDEAKTSLLPDWAILLLGYALFIWCSLGLITMATTSPDILMSVFVYLAFVLLLRIRRGHNEQWSFFMLGFILGMGYLAKASMLPLAAAFLLVALLLAGGLRKAPVRFAAGLLGLFLVAGPFIAALSASKHRLTWGDSGRLNYLWHVNQVPVFHWQGEDPRFGTPKHPTRKIFPHPAVYEFGSPLNTTYPPWYDPSYWYEGATPRFDLRPQAAAVRRVGRVYWDLFLFRSHLALLGGFLALAYLGRKRFFSNLYSEWSLLVIPLVAFALYLPVHVETRYVAPFIPPLWLGLFASLRLPAGERSRTLIKYVVIAMAALIVLAQTTRSVSAFRSDMTDSPRRQSALLYLQVAQELSRRGLQPGDAVGLINFNPNWLPMVHWARLAHVRVVAELPNTDSDAFAAANDPIRREIVETFAKTGAKVLIAARVPENVTLAGWERIGQTSYYVLKLGPP